MTAYSGVPAPYRSATLMRAPRRIVLVYAVTLSLLAAVAVAQSFDCGRADNPVDRAICASPRLRQLDTDLAAAYTAALRRAGTQTDAIRQAQRSWASSRAACTAGAQ